MKLLNNAGVRTVLIVALTTAANGAIYLKIKGHRLPCLSSIQDCEVYVEQCPVKSNDGAAFAKKSEP